jgi:hypothetical protein
MAYTVAELTSAKYTGTLTDESGAAVSGSALTAATLTLFDDVTGTVINSRNAQNVLNANGVTIDNFGALTWVMAPADNTIVKSGLSVERHRAVFTFTWGAGKQLVHEVVIAVTNIRMVP